MSEGVAKAVSAAAQQAMHPLVRFLLEAKIGPAEFYAMAKATYVHVAHERRSGRSRRGQRRANISGIATDTGLGREEVKAILELPVGETPPAQVRGGKVRTQRVLDAWWELEEFQDPVTAGPALLELKGGRRSFATLVKRHSGGGQASVKPVLDELVRSHAVRQLEDGLLQAVSRTCASVGWDAAGIAGFGEQLRQLGEHLLHNLTHPEDPRFARRVCAEVDPKAVFGLTRQIHDKAEVFLAGVQETLSPSKHQQKSKRPGKNPIQLIVSVQVAQPPARDADDD